jgi:hypothetical protein
VQQEVHQIVYYLYLKDQVGDDRKEAVVVEDNMKDIEHENVEHVMVEVMVDGKHVELEIMKDI